MSLWAVEVTYTTPVGVFVNADIILVVADSPEDARARAPFVVQQRIASWPNGFIAGRAWLVAETAR